MATLVEVAHCGSGQQLSRHARRRLRLKEEAAAKALQAPAATNLSVRQAKSVQRLRFRQDDATEFLDNAAVGEVVIAPSTFVPFLRTCDSVLRPDHGYVTATGFLVSYLQSQRFATLKQVCSRAGIVVAESDSVEALSNRLAEASHEIAFGCPYDRKAAPVE